MPKSASKTSVKTPKTQTGSHEALLATLESRFKQHPARHPGVKWEQVLTKLLASPTKMQVLAKMEETGGEPDVVSFDKKSPEVMFVDCAAESPKERRSICYDRAALNSRKEHKPKSSAEDMAKEIGVELINEEQYRELQKLGEFDLKTSSWIKTPERIRKLGGALFCDRRFDTVFTYHNGAESYYGGRGFRGLVRI